MPRPKLTHCKNGHEYTPDNTLTWEGARHCRTCRRKRQREYMERMRAIYREQFGHECPIDIPETHRDAA